MWITDCADSLICVMAKKKLIPTDKCISTNLLKLNNYIRPASYKVAYMSK